MVFDVPFGCPLKPIPKKGGRGPNTSRRSFWTVRREETCECPAVRRGARFAWRHQKDTELQVFRFETNPYGNVHLILPSDRIETNRKPRHFLFLRQSHGLSRSTHSPVEIGPFARINFRVLTVFPPQAIPWISYDASFHRR